MSIVKSNNHLKLTAIPAAVLLYSTAAIGGVTCAVPALEAGCTYTFPVLAPEIVVSPSYAPFYNLGSDTKVISWNSGVLDLCQSSIEARTSCVSYTKACPGRPLITNSCGERPEDDGDSEDGGVILIDDGSGSNQGITPEGDAGNEPSSGGTDNNGGGDNTNNGGGTAGGGGSTGGTGAGGNNQT